MTKTDAENTPSGALTAWWKAFFTRDAKAFAEGFAQNVVLEASALRKPVEGSDRVRQMVWTTAEIYESLAFTDQAGSGQRISVEWVATAFGGKQLRGSTILVTNEEGKIDHAVVQRRPLDGLLASSAELGKRMSGVNADRRVSSLLIQSENPLPATRHVRGRRGGLRSKQAASGTSYAQALKAVFPGAL